MATAKPTLTEAKIRDTSKAMLQAWNDHSVEGILALLTDDVLWSDPGLTEPAHGKEAVAAHLRDVFKAFPDLHLPVEDVHMFPSVEQQANVATWTLTATMTGPLEMGLPATGKRVRTRGATVSRFRDDEVCEYTSHWDSLDFLQQLALLPKTDGLGFKAIIMADVLADKATDLAGKATDVAGKALKAVRR